MSSLGNVAVVAVGYHDYLCEIVTGRQWTVFSDPESADEWSSQFGEKPNGTYLVSFAEGHSDHMQDLVEDALHDLQQQTHLQRAKDRLYKAADKSANAAALARAAALLLGEEA